MSIKQMAKVWEWSKSEGPSLLVMLALADHADDDGFCYPGIERIAKKCRVSGRSVQRHIKDLCSLGELKVETGKGVTVQGGATNRYRITVNHGEQARTQSGVNLSPPDKSGEVVTAVAGSGDRAVSPKTSVEPSDKTSTADAEACAIAFAEFWQAYPRKTGDKQKCQALFKERRIFEKIEVVLSSLEAHLNSRQWKEGIIPHPHTWLYQSRWENDLTHEQTHPKSPARSNQERGGKTNREGAGQYAGAGRLP